MSSKSKSSDSDSKKHRGLVSHLFHHHADDNDDPKPPNSQKSASSVTFPDKAPQSASVQLASPKSETRPKTEPIATVPTVQQPMTIAGPPKKSRREDAEQRLQDSTAALSKLISKSPAPVSDAIKLQKLTNVKDVEGTAKQLESAIDDIIDARKIKANADSRRVWKDCIKSWFKAIYPYINVGLTEVEVI